MTITITELLTITETLCCLFNEHYKIGGECSKNSYVVQLCFIYVAKGH